MFYLMSGEGESKLSYFSNKFIDTRASRNVTHVSSWEGWTSQERAGLFLFPIDHYKSSRSATDSDTYVYRILYA